MRKHARIHAFLPNQNLMKFRVESLPFIGRSDYHIKAINDIYAEINLKAIEEYVITLKKKRDHKLSSIRTFCNDLRASYRQALGERYDYDEHIKNEMRRTFSRITPTEGPRQSSRPLIALEEFRRLTVLGNPKYSCLVKLLGFTAVRITESSLIRNKDITDLKNGDSAVYIYGKRAKERIVPVPTDIIEDVRENWNSLDKPFLFSSTVDPSKALDRRTLSFKIRHHSVRLIGRSTCPHDYRAFFGTNAYEESPEQLKEIMALMGIASVEVFIRHYKKLRPLRQMDFDFLSTGMRTVKAS